MMLKHSLRWRLVAAFGLIIVLTVFLSGALSLWATRDRFGILVTEQDRDWAEKIAPLMEASYAYWGNWRGLDELFSDPLDDELVPKELFVTEWFSDIDWWAIAAHTLGLDQQSMREYLEQGNSLAQVAEYQDVAPQAIANAIIAAEQQASDKAVSNGKLTAGQALDEMEWVHEIITAFVWNTDKYKSIEGIAWEAIVAEELGISEEALYGALDVGISITDLSLEYGVAPEHLVNTIVQAEKEMLHENGFFSQEEIAWQLCEIEQKAWAFIKPEFAAPAYVGSVDWTDEGVEWLLDTLLKSNARLLVADSAGWVVYDGAGEHTGKQLPAAMLEQGVPLWNHAQDELAGEAIGEPIGTVIVTTGSDYYDAHQAAFLRGVNRALLLSGALAGIAALFVGLYVARRVTAPVSALTQAAHRMAEGDWSARVSAHTNDELGQMSTAFNTMAGALENQRDLRNRLVNDVAHELATPLSVIQAELEALKDQYQSPDEAAAHVEREIELLRNLVNDLSLLAEADKGELELGLEPIDLAQFTAKAVARWRSQAEANGIELCMLPAESLPPVDADSSQMAQVLGNLIANALQHTPPGGRIEVCCRQDRDPVYVSTTIADTGEGIPATDQAHVFERFYRTDLSRSRRTGGQGLGLAIVRRIVEQHGGEVWVESIVGEGSTFGHRLPVKR